MATAVKPVPADVQPQVAAVTDNARKVLERRYLIRDHESGNVVETPEQLFWRVASNIAQADALYGATAEQVEQTAREFYKVMATLAFQPNTPCLVNAGRELQQLAACFVLPVEDDLHSIFETIKHAALIHKSGGGCIAGDARVWTTFCGIEPIEVLFNRATADGRSGVWQNKGIAYDVRDLGIQTVSMNPTTGETGLRPVTHVWRFDVPAQHQTVVTMREGTVVQTSDWHPFMVVRGTELVEVRADELQPGDVVLAPNRPDTYWPWHEEKTIGHLTLDPDLGWLVGFTLGGGSFGYVPSLRQYRVRWFSGTADVLERVQQILAKYDIHVSIQRDARGLLNVATLNQKFVHTLLEACGLEKFGPKDNRIRVPESVAKSPLPVVRAFLAGLLDSDGYVADDGSPSYSTTSAEMSEDLAALVSLLGYQPAINAKAPHGKGKQTGYVVQLCPLPQVNDLADDIAPYLANTQRRERLHSDSRRQTALQLSFHAWRDRLAQLDLVKVRGDKVGGSGPCAAELNRWSSNVGGRCRRDDLLAIAASVESRDPELARFMKRIAANGQEVESVERAVTPQAFYDLSVEEWNTYAAGRSGLTMIHNTGFSFSRIRPKGDMVLTTSGVASGPVSFMKVYDAATEAVKQGGVRRGANMAILSIEHPDIEEFISMKDDLNVLNNFNISVAITENFMHCVEHNLDHELKNPRTGEVVRKIRARDLFEKIVDSAWRTGEPGIVFMDRINATTNTTPQVGMIESTNPCVTGDTRLHTQYGLLTMRELYEGELPVMATVDTRALGEDRGATVRSAVPVFMTAKDADIFRVITEDGYEIRATEWHDFYTTHGKIKLRDLQVGDKLLVQSGEGQWGDQGDYKLGLLIGLITGDGYITADRGACINLWGEDQELMPQVAEYVNELVAGKARGYRKEYVVQPVEVADRNLATLRSTRLARILEHYDFTAATKLQVPEVIWQGRRDCVIGYLHGLFQTDGTVAVSEKSETCSIRLASSNPELLKGVQTLLANFGIFSSIKLRREAGERLMPDGKGGSKTYHYRAQFDLIVDGESRTRFMDAIGFPLPQKNDKVRTWAEGRLLRKHQPFTTTIKAIVYEGREPVYDTTQNDHNTLIFNGLVTGNCGEQPLLPYESCNLGSINLNMVLVDGPDGKPVIDWTMLRKLARTGVHFLDNIVDMNNYPLPQIEEITHRNRRIGLGVMGWADILFKMEIGYNTPEAVALAEEVMRVIEEEAHKTSQELAETRGCFANWEGSTFQKQGKKMRNCGVTTIAPTGTISVIAGASSGIEPLFALAFFRNVMDGTKLPEVNSYFREIAEREGWGSPEVYEAVAEHGTCQGVPGVPEKWQQVFVTAHDITPEWHIRMQAAWQHNTDAAISKTCNFRNEATREEIEEVYRLAYKLGCKGVTVYRDGCRFNQVLNTGSTPTPEKAAEPKAEAPKEQAEPVLTINNDSFAAQLYAVQASSKAHPTWTTLCVSMEHGYPEVLPRPLPPAEEQLWAQEFRVETPLGNMRMFVSEVDGKPFEVFIMIGRSGSDVMAFTEAIGRLLSIALRAGIPVAVLADQLRDVGGRSSVGFGPNRIVSVPDAIAKVLTRSYINNPGHGHNGSNGNGNGHSASNGNGTAKPELVTMHVNGTAPGEAEVSPALAAIRNTRTVREICPSCKNATLEYTEGCKKCQCGYSEC